MREFNKKVEDVLNKQINAEFWSSYMYLAMSTYLEEKSLRGFANWMRVQYQEELTHALKLVDHVLSQGGHVELRPIEEVPTSWKNLMDVFESTYKHECVVTDMIGHCHDIALQEKDRYTVSMLQWFIDEQAEEESSALEIIDQLKLIGENGQAIYMMDKEMATRVFVDSTKTN